MKISKFIMLLLVVLISMLLYIGCSEILDTTPQSELSEQTLGTEKGLNAALSSAYNRAHLNEFWGETAYAWFSLLTAGEAWTQGGGVNTSFAPIQNFNFNTNNMLFQVHWQTLYTGIKDANLILENLDEIEIDIESKDIIRGEVKFIRGWSYAELYSKYGPVPLRKTTADDVLLPRSSEEDIKLFIEQELIEASSLLPNEPVSYGRASKGATLGILMQFYLNDKQWQRTAEVALEIIEMGEYELLSNYEDVFAIDNEANEEMIWTLTREPNAGNTINAFSFPVDFPLPFSNLRVFAAETFLFDSLVNSFEENDARRNMIITEYTNSSGNQVIGLGNDKSLALKYPWDPNADASNAGNDIPVVRYADVLLSRAEALNELNGPNQESIDLVNQIRDRAGIELLNIEDFNQQSLRDQIFEEREKEFFYEFRNREDRIRHGTFIEKAQVKGKSAQPFHIRFPIPESEIDANPNIEQNEGF